MPANSLFPRVIPPTDSGISPDSPSDRKRRRRVIAMGCGDTLLTRIGVHNPGGGRLGVIGYAVGVFSLLPGLVE